MRDGASDGGTSYELLHVIHANSAAYTHTHTHTVASVAGRDGIAQTATKNSDDDNDNSRNNDTAFSECMRNSSKDSQDTPIQCYRGVAAARPLTMTNKQRNRTRHAEGAKARATARARARDQSKMSGVGNGAISCIDFGTARDIYMREERH